MWKKSYLEFILFSAPSRCHVMQISFGFELARQGMKEEGC
jgi:hypothetical protein